MDFRTGIYEWVKPPKWPEFICSDLLPIITWLRTQNIEISQIGYWNIKSPDIVIFLSAPIPHRQLQLAFPRAKPPLVLHPDYIGCSDHRLTLVFEKP